MQHEREDALTNAPPSQDSLGVLSQEELEASWSRIGGALGTIIASTSTSSPFSTRKRVAQDETVMRKKAQPSYNNDDSNNNNSNNNNSVHTWQCHLCRADNLDALSYRCGVCGIRKENTGRSTTTGRGRLQRRGSISSTSSNDSFTIDDLVHNLEGIEVNIHTTTTTNNNNNHSATNGSELYNDLLYSSSRNGNASIITDSWNDSVSRLSSGMWSLHDLEKWSCATCTFDNEPLSCACEMCGQSKPPPMRRSAAHAINLTIGAVEAAATTRPASNLEAESIRILQEARLREISSSCVQAAVGKAKVATATVAAAPAAATDGPFARLTISATAATNKSSLSPRPPLVVRPGTSSKRRSVSPVPRRGTFLSNLSSTMSHHTTAIATATATKNINELSLSNLFDDSSLQKPRRLDLQDSAATATTFDMSSAAFSYFADQQTYPGIEEEEEIVS